MIENVKFVSPTAIFKIFFVSSEKDSLKIPDE